MGIREKGKRREETLTKRGLALARAWVGCFKKRETLFRFHWPKKAGSEIKFAGWGEEGLKVVQSGSRKYKV